MRAALLVMVVALAGCGGEPMHGDACAESEARHIICGVTPRAGEADQVAALWCDPDTKRLNAIALCGECEAEGSATFRCDGRLQAWHEDPCEGDTAVCADADSILRCVDGAWTSEKCGGGRHCSTVTDSPECL